MAVLPRVLVLLSWFVLAGGAMAADTRELVRKAKSAIVFLKGKDASGTGFFISSDGKIVTNYHVIEGFDTMSAITASDTVLQIEGVLAADPANDIAIVQAQRGEYPTLPLAASADVEQGTHVYVLGHPQGLRLTLTDGLVSATRRPAELKEWRSEMLPTAEVLQISAPVSPGSSGSPVMLDTGEVIGVAQSLIASGQNLNFAVPVSVVHDLLREIKPDQKPHHLRSAKLIARKQGRSGEILWNLAISAAIFGGLFLGGRWLIARGNR